MKFSNTDQKIITELYHGWRASISQIAKSTKLSRRQVEYRLSNYLNSGAIRTFFTVYDYHAIGFNQVAYAFIKLKKELHTEQINNLFNKSERCTSWGFALSTYDLFSNWIFKNQKEANSYFNELKKNKIIEKIEIIYPSEAIYYPLKPINSYSKDIFSLTDASKVIQVDDKDKIILKELSQDARKSIVDISDKVKLTPEACLYRLRTLKDKKVILGSRIQFNLKESGYFATCLFIDSKHPEILFNKLKDYCVNSPNVNYFISSLSKSPNYIIQIFHRDESILREIMNDLRKICSIGSSIRVVLLQDDFGIINPLPFW